MPITPVWQFVPLAFLAAPVAYGLGRPLNPLLITALTVLLVWSVRSVRLLLEGGSAIPRAVVALIAGSSLVDGVFTAARGAGFATAMCVLAFAATLWLQRNVTKTAVFRIEGPTDKVSFLVVVSASCKAVAGVGGMGKDTGFDFIGGAINKTLATWAGRGSSRLKDSNGAPGGSASDTVRSAK